MFSRQLLVKDRSQLLIKTLLRNSKSNIMEILLFHHCKWCFETIKVPKTGFYNHRLPLDQQINTFSPHLETNNYWSDGRVNKHLLKTTTALMSGFAGILSISQFFFIVGMRGLTSNLHDCHGSGKDYKFMVLISKISRFSHTCHNSNLYIFFTQTTNNGFFIFQKEIYLSKSQSISCHFQSKL